MYSAAASLTKHCIAVTAYRKVLTRMKKNVKTNHGFICIYKAKHIMFVRQ